MTAHSTYIVTAGHCKYTHAMLGVEPEELSVQQWKSFAHYWPSYNKSSMPTQAYCFHMNEVFANHSEEDEIYHLPTEEMQKPNGLTRL